MGLLLAVILGFVCGALARVLMPGKHEMGLLATMFLGIAGCFAARVLGSMLGVYAAGETAGLIGGTLGSVGVLWAYEQFATQNPSYSKEVAGKFDQVLGQFKAAAKNTVSTVEDVAFREKPKTVQPAPANEESKPASPS